MGWLTLVCLLVCAALGLLGRGAAAASVYDIGAAAQQAVASAPGLQDAASAAIVALVWVAPRRAAPHAE